jgi:hypothetical protein
MNDFCRAFKHIASEKLPRDLYNALEPHLDSLFFEFEEALAVIRHMKYLERRRDRWAAKARDRWAACSCVSCTSPWVRIPGKRPIRKEYGTRVNPPPPRGACLLPRPLGDGSD